MKRGLAIVCIFTCARSVMAVNFDDLDDIATESVRLTKVRCALLDVRDRVITCERLVESPAARLLDNEIDQLNRDRLWLKEESNKAETLLIATKSVHVDQYSDLDDLVTLAKKVIQQCADFGSRLESVRWCFVLRRAIDVGTFSCVPIDGVDDK